MRCVDQGDNVSSGGTWKRSGVKQEETRNPKMADLSVLGPPAPQTVYSCERKKEKKRRRDLKIKEQGLPASIHLPSKGGREESFNTNFVGIPLNPTPPLSIAVSQFLLELCLGSGACLELAELEPFESASGPRAKTKSRDNVKHRSSIVVT
jgi:hypothetical protein